MSKLSFHSASSYPIARYQQVCCQYLKNMGDLEPHRSAVTILDVLGVDLCARAILDYVPVKELVRSERVCRQWQRAVRDYLHSCRTLRFYDVKLLLLQLLPRINVGSIDRNIVIFPAECSAQSACKIIEKWRPSIVKLTTERYDEEYFQIIASNCSNLQHIQIGVSDKSYRQLKLINKFNQLKQISLRYWCTSPNLDDVLGEALQNIECEKIKIFSMGLTGRFLKFVKSKDFKSLSLRQCVSLSFSDLLCATHILRNITSLALDKNFQWVLQKIHLLLKEMPLLEELSLRDYTSGSEEMCLECIGEESIQAFSQLVNLKRLDMKDNGSVDDALLEALARGCKKLEYLDIRGCYLDCVGRNRVSARGVAALCRRSSAAFTIIHLGFLEYKKDIVREDVDIEDYLNNPVVKELKTLCCVEPTPQGLKAASAVWSSRCRRVPLELSSGCKPTNDQDSRQKLKIMLL